MSLSKILFAGFDVMSYEKSSYMCVIAMSKHWANCAHGLLLKLQQSQLCACASTVSRGQLSPA